jgi:hypothetical protein
VQVISFKVTASCTDLNVLFHNSNASSGSISYYVEESSNHQCCPTFTMLNQASPPPLPPSPPSA